MARIIKSSEIDAHGRIEMTPLALPEMHEALDGAQGSYAPVDPLGDLELSSRPAVSNVERPAGKEDEWLDK